MEAFNRLSRNDFVELMSIWRIPEGCLKIVEIIVKILYWDNVPTSNDPYHPGQKIKLYEHAFRIMWGNPMRFER